MTVLLMMSVPMRMMMVVAVPTIVLMWAIIGFERRRHLNGGQSMLRDQCLNLGPPLQPDAVA